MEFDMPYEPVVLNTIAIAEYDDGTFFPLVKINYVFDLTNDGELLSVISRNSSAISPYSAYSADLNTNMWVLFLNGPYGFCSWRQLAWHSGNSIIFGLGRNSEFWHVNPKGETVVDWSLMPVGDCDLPVFGHINIFDQDVVEPVVADELFTMYSFGNEIWKVPDKDILQFLGDSVGDSPSFSPVKSIISVPKSGSRFLDAKIISSILEFRGNPEQVFRTSEMKKRIKYGSGKIGSMWVGEKLFPGRFNSLKWYTRTRSGLEDILWRIKQDQVFDDRSCFWAKNLYDQQLGGELYTVIENSQGGLMDKAAVAAGDSFNRWPLVTQVDSTVFKGPLFPAQKYECGELATAPYNDSTSGAVQPAAEQATLMFSPIADHLDGYQSSVDKLASVDMEWKYHASLQAGKSPWYDSHESFLASVRPLSKGLSVIPEFRISEIVESGGDGKTELGLYGSDISNLSFDFESLTDDFSSKLVLSSEPISSVEFSKQTGAKKRKIRVDFDALKKLHPYSGFFPADRLVQIGGLLHDGYQDCVLGVDEANSGKLFASSAVALRKSWQSFLNHLASPGILFNSIKSALGVGHPLFYMTSSDWECPQVVFRGDTYAGQCIMSSPRAFLPFESLFDVKRYFPNYSSINDSNFKKHWNKLMFYLNVWESNFNDGAYSHEWNCFLSPTNSKSLFERANNNFFGETTNIFLKNGLTSFLSKPESQYKSMVGGTVYYMDVVLKNKNCVICEGYKAEAPTSFASYSSDFVGTGVNDAIWSGTFNSGYYRVAVKISDSVSSPDKFVYSINGGDWSLAETSINSAAPQAIAGTGVSIKFDKNDGHTLGDIWYLSAQRELSLSQRGSIFGFPLSMNPALGDSSAAGYETTQREWDIRDPAYGPFCPPYFYGDAVARISFDPQEADPSLATGASKWFSLEEILKAAEIRLYEKTMSGGQIVLTDSSGIDNYDASPGASDELNDYDGLYHEFDWRGALYDTEDSVYSTAAPVTRPLESTILQSGFMNIAQSVDLFNKKVVPSVSIESVQRPGLFSSVTRDTGAGKELLWCINTKWESPVLQFNKHSTSTYDNMGSSAVEWPGRPRGIWMDYGEEPASDEGLFLELRESFPEKLTKNRVVKGFLSNVARGTYDGTEMDDVIYGEAAELGEEVGGIFIPKKKVGSLIEVCGFEVTEKRIGEVKEEFSVEEAVVALPFVRNNGVVEFFEIDRKILEGQLDNKRNLGFAHKTIYGDELKDTSITKLADSMTKFVFPPWLDFVNGTATPRVMYVGEFSVDLDKSDLLDFWQNFAGDSFYTADTGHFSVEHGLDEYEFFHGVEVPENIEFAVFKVKKRAAWDYFSTKPNYSAEEAFALSLTHSGQDKSYNFNWPYDFCSVVEYGKVSCSFEFVGE